MMTVKAVSSSSLAPLSSPSFLLPKEAHHLDLLIKEIFRQIMEQGHFSQLVEFSCQKAQQFCAVASDLSSIFRNAGGLFLSNTALVTILGVLGGAASMGAGGFISADELKNCYNASLINDQEGKNLAGIGFAGGASYTLSGVGLFLNKTLALSHITQATTALNLGVITPFSAGLNLFFGIFGAYQCFQACSFRSEFNIAKDMDDQSALKVLSDFLTLTPAEIKPLLEELSSQAEKIEQAYESLPKKEVPQRSLALEEKVVEFLRMSPEKAKEFVSAHSEDKVFQAFAEPVIKKMTTELYRLLDKKKAQLIRRTSKGCVEEIEKLILKNGKIEPAEAKALLEAVSKENFKRIFTSSFLIFLSVVGIACILASFFIAGAAPLAFGALLSGLWFLFDHTWVCDKIGDGMWLIRQAIYSHKQESLIAPAVAQ